jgi:hypothetical protein
MKRNSTDRRDEALDKILGDLGREHRAVEAPAHLERLLGVEAERVAAPARQAHTRRIWAWGVGFAVLACVLLSMAAWQAHRNRSGAGQQMRVVPQRTPNLAQAPLQASNSGGEYPKRRVENSAPSQTRKRTEGARRANGSSDLSLADFVALPASEGLPAASEISLVRMRIEGSALQQYGLEIPAEAAPRTLLAEFAVGEDGLPRAIRIVQ